VTAGESFLERLSAKRRARTAVIAKFERTRARLPTAIFLVFEALPDKAFYSDMLESQLSGQQTIPLFCEGKPGVLAFLHHVRERHGQDDGVIFFVDRDLDDFTSSDGNIEDRFVYLTDGYSIENFVVTEEAFRSLVSHVLHVQAEEDELARHAQEFATSLHNFSRQILPLMAWAVAARKLGGALSLNNASPNQLFDLTDIREPRRTKGALKKFVQQTGANVSLTKVCAIRPVISALENPSPTKFIRGKYLLWFFMKYLDVFKQQLEDDHKSGGPRGYLKPHIDEHNIFQLLCHRLKCPESLRHFLAIFLEMRAQSSREQR
jgi:hypothetical protein